MLNNYQFLKKIRLTKIILDDITLHGATARSAAAPHYYQRGGISMTEDEAYKVHIQYTFNAFCKIVIRHAAIDKILKLRRRWEREVSLDYLMNEKFVQLAEPEQLEEYLFTACDQTAVLYHAELAAALARLPEQTQEEIFRYYFLRQPQRVIGVHIGRTRSTAGRHKIRYLLDRQCSIIKSTTIKIYGGKYEKEIQHVA